MTDFGTLMVHDNATHCTIVAIADMYIPTQFQVTERDELFRFIGEHAFGQLISIVDGALFATHIPFLLNDAQTHLLGHVARKNPQWREVCDQEVLVTFLGEHAYVSPAWYESPGVPTWNYRAVHVYGQCRAFTDANRLAGLVEALTRQHESGFETPWQPDYRPQMLNAIVGLDIEITEIQGKYKLSQNRSPQDRHEVAQQFELSGFNLLAKAMKSGMD